MEAVTWLFCSQGHESVLPETVIQFAPATGYKQSQKTSSSHSTFFYFRSHNVSPSTASRPLLLSLTLLLGTLSSLWDSFSITSQRQHKCHPGGHPSLHRQRNLTPYFWCLLDCYFVCTSNWNLTRSGSLSSLQKRERQCALKGKSMGEGKVTKIFAPRDVIL